ncbi:HepT-like ribonuclease domain-containing protein [Rhizobium sp. NFR03]|uniref:HepT-like ribonuclease domain-containing protein n=1 Tax=Rhizobium sp. NFR03 TaxID=1566263 RepID=UPI0008C52920|nr:HepT-like ribonuclease domain-containing protein [Rhizobium sp. NFR03]SER98693.1 Uncharacterized conserved protein, contains HEPN domain [Rhizobium sp. NFR03]
MKVASLVEHLLLMQEMAHDAEEFCESLDCAQFLADRKTQQACILNLLIMGECSSRILKEQPAFADFSPYIPHRNMKGMRNHIAHGFSTLNLETIWATLDQFLPNVIAVLPAAIEAAVRYENDL